MAKNYESMSRSELALINRLSERAIFWGLVVAAALIVVAMLTGAVALA